MLVVLATAFVTPWTTAFMSSDALALHSRVAVAGTVRTGKPLTKLDVRSLRTTVANDGCGFWCEKTKQRRGSLSTADPSSAGDWSYKSVTRSRLATVGGDVDGMTRRVCEVKPAYTIVITMGSARGWGGITSWLPWRGKAKATTTPAPQVCVIYDGVLVLHFCPVVVFTALFSGKDRAAVRLSFMRLLMAITQ